MKRILFIIAFVGALATGGMAYAQMAPETVYKGTVTVEPNGLQQVGDSLVLDFDLHVQAGAVQSCEMMMLTPEMTDGAISRHFRPYLSSGSRSCLWTAAGKRCAAIRPNMWSHI